MKSINKNKIKVAIVGVGNCASSLIQGVSLYKKEHSIVGLMHKNICGYELSNIDIVLAYDINKNKIGENISDAIFVEPNNANIFYSGAKCFKNKVKSGPILDGISKLTKDLFNPHSIKKSLLKWESEIVKDLKDNKIDILVLYLPVGSKKVVEFYVKCALNAHVAIANAIPVFICSEKKWSDKFAKIGVPCAGDDIKSQVGATILHRKLVSLIESRGQVINDTFQLNIGGNTDFLNMLEEDRLKTKRISKTEAVSGISNSKFGMRIGPSDYVAHLKDNKICFIEINGKQFGGVPFKIEAKLSVEDSPNSAGIMVDVIRLLKVSLDRGIGGYQEYSSYYFKRPAKQIKDNDAKNVVEKFIKN